MAVAAEMETLWKVRAWTLVGLPNGIKYELWVTWPEDGFENRQIPYGMRFEVADVRLVWFVERCIRKISFFLHLWSPKVPVRKFSMIQITAFTLCSSSKRNNITWASLTYILYLICINYNHAVESKIPDGPYSPPGYRHNRQILCNPSHLQGEPSCPLTPLCHPT